MATAVLDPQQEKKDNYLVGGRKLGLVAVSLSIAATWIWAPGLFVSATQAYNNGILGFLWMVVPNALALVFFAAYAQRLRDRIPNGYTLSGYMRERYSPRTQKAYHAQLIIQDVASFTVQLLAGGTIISLITGIPYFWVVVTMAGIVLAYSLTGGIRASILTDYVQYVLMIGIIIGVVIPVIWIAGGIPTIIDGFSGVNNPDFFMFMLTFGIPTTIILFSGPFGFSGYWQRGLALKNPAHVKKAFMMSAGFFALIPIFMGFLGLVAAGYELDITNPGNTNIEVIRAFLPEWSVWLFTIAIVMGLTSTLDSAMAGSSTIWGHDYSPNGYNHKVAVTGTAIIGVIGTAIAFIPGLTILYLWFFYGTSRAATMVPTIMTLSKESVSSRITDRGMFWGVVGGLILGAPVLIYGQVTGSWQISITGSLASIAIPTVILLATRNRKTDNAGV